MASLARRRFVKLFPTVMQGRFSTAATSEEVESDLIGGGHVGIAAAIKAGRIGSKTISNYNVNDVFRIESGYQKQFFSRPIEEHGHTFLVFGKWAGARYSTIGKVTTRRKMFSCLRIISAGVSRAYLPAIPYSTRVYLPVEGLSDDKVHIGYGTEQYKDEFGVQMNSLYSGSYCFSNMNVDPLPALVRFISKEEIETAKALWRVKHPNLLDLIALLKLENDNILIFDGVKCSLEAFVSNEVRLSELSEFYVSPDGSKSASMLSPLGQNLIRQILDAICCLHKAKIAVGNFAEKCFLMTPTSKFSLNLKLLGLRTCDAVNRTDLRNLEDFLKNHIYIPLKLSTVELCEMLGVSNSNLLTEANLGTMLKSPLFWTVEERITFICEMSDILHSAERNSLPWFNYFMHSRNCTGWGSRIDGQLLNEMQSRAQYNIIDASSRLRLERNACQHRASISGNFLKSGKPNVLGRNIANTQMYFRSLDWEFLGLLRSFQLLHFPLIRP